MFNLLISSDRWLTSGKSIKTSAISLPRSPLVNVSSHFPKSWKHNQSLPSDVNNDVAVGELRHGLRNDSLATAESTRDTDSTTLDRGEESVKHTLADNERLGGRELVGGGTRDTDRPLVHHAVLGLLALELELQNVGIDSVLALLGHLLDSTASAGREKNAVDVEQRVLPDGTEAVTASNVVALFEVLAGRELPLLGAVQAGHVNAAGNVDAAADVADTLEWALDTIVDGLHETGTELDGERLAGTDDRVANSNASGFLVDLDGGLVGVDTNDFTNELLVADLAQLVHGATDHVLGDNDGTGNGEDGAMLLLFLL